jgi:type II secretory pathway component GspD/PulD (secretin)
MSGRRFFARVRLCIGSLMLLLGVCSLVLPSARAQKAPPAQESSSAEYIVCHLKYVDAAEAVGIVEKLLPAEVRPRIRLVADSRTNSLLVSGRREDGLLVKRCLDLLDHDSPAQPPKEQQFKVFPLRNIAPDEGFEKGLATVFPQGANRFVVDHDRRSVIVSGDEECLRVTDKYLRLLDVPREKPPVSQVRVRIVWLANGLGNPQAAAPPRDMKTVTDELATLGLNDLRTVSQSLINVTEGVKFNNDGVADLDVPCSLSIEGVVESRLGTGKVLTFSINAFHRNDPKPGPLCRLSSSIETSLNQLVVLGVTPTGTATSVFVIQVLPQ